MNGTSSPAAANRTLLIVAFATVYVVWGSTYLAIRVAVETMPPFLLAGVRFLVAGAAMFIYLRLKGVAMPNKQQWLHAAIAGILMLLGGNGLVVWAEQTVSSSLAALLVALTLVWFALLDWARPAGKRPAIYTWAGIIVGFVGVALLVSGHHAPNINATQNPWGVAALIAAGFLWAAGSLWSRYHVKPESPWMNAAAQMICGGAVLLLLSLFRHEPAHFHLAQVSLQSFLALLYLIVCGSWIAFSAYVWLLKATTPSRLATYAYVNPLIAVLLGVGILGEPLGARTLWAAATILAGVVITTLPKHE
ncbi:MAG TPA: EamA family transporter [Verrucomicrobiae bacterium]|nr:EamA family transporter [Verrucomicrobiae bacterium]